MILVCGSRKWTDREAITEIVKTYSKDNIWLIHGDCEGADRIAGHAAKKAGMGVVSFSAPWEKLTLSAGPVRNRLMLDLKPKVVIGFHDDIEESKGTKDCMAEANRRGYPTLLWTHKTKQLESWRR